jgi:hypothetical protein
VVVAGGIALGSADRLTQHSTNNEGPRSPPYRLDLTYHLTNERPPTTRHPRPTAVLVRRFSLHSNRAHSTHGSLTPPVRSFAVFARSVRSRFAASRCHRSAFRESHFVAGALRRSRFTPFTAHRSRDSRSLPSLRIAPAARGTSGLPVRVALSLRTAHCSPSRASTSVRTRA